jgi:hypothetical protein
MIRIPNITAYPNQSISFVLPDGSAFSMILYFVPMQQGWFITKLIYNNFELDGIRITNNPNILYQFQNVIPFGLSCFTAANREPSLQEDFSSKISNLYVLTAAEVADYNTFIEGGGIPA